MQSIFAKNALRFCEEWNAIFGQMEIVLAEESCEWIKTKR